MLPNYAPLCLFLGGKASGWGRGRSLLQDPFGLLQCILLRRRCIAPVSIEHVHQLLDMKEKTQ